MRKERKTYHCTLTPLTPIQVGNGNQIYPYNYVIKNGFYYRIELSETIEKFPNKIKDDFIRLLENNNMVKIRSFIFDNYKEEYGYLYKSPVDKNVETDYFNKINGAKKSNEENQLIVEEFIGNHMGKFIPGSTIKGALRNAFLFGEFKKEECGYTLNRETEDKRGRKIRTAPFILKNVDRKYEKKEADKREARILGLNNLEPKVDPFKNLIVTDTETDNDLIKIKKIERVSIKDNKANMPMGDFELTKSRYSDNEEKDLKFKIIINEYDISDEKLNNLLKNNKDSFDIIKSNNRASVYIENLFEYLNLKAKSILKEDIKFFDKAGEIKLTKVSKKLLEQLENLKENEALVRFGRGAGFNSTTLNLANNNDTVYTRVISDNCPVGWAVISYNEIE